MAPSLTLLRVLALAQLVVAAILWDKDRGIALVFVAIAVGIVSGNGLLRSLFDMRHLPHTPSKRQVQKLRTRR